MADPPRFDLDVLAGVPERMEKEQGLFAACQIHDLVSAIVHLAHKLKR